MKMNEEFDNAEIDENVDFTQFEEKFFEAVKAGNEYQHFLNLSFQFDCMLIRSILASMNIPTYVEGMNINKLYGGAFVSTLGDFNIKLYILVDDYDDALVAVKDYLKSKIDSESSEIDRNKALQVLELIVASTTVSTPQELLGISILPKKE